MSNDRIGRTSHWGTRIVAYGGGVFCSAIGYALMTSGDLGVGAVAMVVGVVLIGFALVFKIAYVVSLSEDLLVVGAGFRSFEIPFREVSAVRAWGPAARLLHRPDRLYVVHDMPSGRTRRFCICAPTPLEYDALFSIAQSGTRV